MKLNRYLFVVKHIEGKRNILPDVLSQLTTREKTSETTNDQEKLEVYKTQVDYYESLKWVIPADS